METQFPKPKNRFFRGKDFQDTTVQVTFKGWERVANQDDPPATQNLRTWKQKLKYQLAYSYPEWAIDTQTGEKQKGRDGKPYQNRNWDERYPYGYTIRYYFEEGQFESGSKPFYDQMCLLQPKVGDQLNIRRTGEGKETIWFIGMEKLSVHPSEPVIDYGAQDDDGTDEQPD